jgi:hypothetical protein
VNVAGGAWIRFQSAGFAFSHELASASRVYMIAGIEVRIGAGGISLLVAKWAWGNKPLNIETAWGGWQRAFTKIIYKNGF